MVKSSDKKWVCVGKITSPHGVRGEVNILSYLEEEGFIASHTHYSTKAGDRTFLLRVRGKKQRFFIAAIEGVTDRNQAEALKGVELYAPRSLFPVAEPEEFYYDDLVGLDVHVAGQVAYGTVVALYNFGAGDVIEISRAVTGKRELYPFTKDIVPEIMLESGYITLVLPEVMNAKEEKPRGAE